MKDVVSFPEEGYEDSGEGGMAVFFILLTNGKDRQKCLAGQGAWPLQDVIVWPHKYRQVNIELSNNKYSSYREADLVVLVGSTKRSLCDSNEYWHAKEKDLTVEGEKLFNLLTEIYGEKPDIVTLLDT